MTAAAMPTTSHSIQNIKTAITEFSTPAVQARMPALDARRVVASAAPLIAPVTQARIPALDVGRMAAAAMPTTSRSIQDIKIAEVGKMVTTAFEQIRMPSFSKCVLRVPNVKKGDLEKYCRNVLGIDDIDIKELPSKRGCFFSIDKKEIFDALNEQSKTRVIGK